MKLVKENKYLIFYKYLKKNQLRLRKQHNKKFISLYQSLLKSFKIQLNEFHRLKCNEKDWEIIIGPWLFYISNIFFFYNDFSSKKYFLKKKFNKNKSSYIAPTDFNDFYTLISKYEFYINHFFKHDIDSSDIYYKKITKINENSFLKKYLNLFTKKISSDKTIIFNSLKISKIDTVKIILFNLFKFLPLYSKDLVKSSIKIENSKTRKVFFSKLMKKNFVEKKLFDLLMHTMPSSYLENFSIIKNYIYLNFPRSNYYLTESSYVNDEFFKINCFLSKKKNLNIIQHGGNMRLYKKNFHDLLENRISNKILVWGKKKASKKEIYFPSTRLNKFKKNFINHEISEYNYCIILEPVRKFYINFFKINSPIKDLKEIVQFFKNLNEKSFSIKLHYEKENSNIIPQQEISKTCKIKKSYFVKDFSDVLKSELVIFNYFSTMIFELLQINKPFVIIVRREDHFFSKFGLNFANELKQNQILFDNVQEFGKFIMKKNLRMWWHSKKNQNFLKKIKINYGLIDDNFSFNKLIKETC